MLFTYLDGGMSLLKPFNDYRYSGYTGGRLSRKNMVKSYTFEEILSDRGYIVYTNTGTSMMPLLCQRRDIIEIRPKGDYRCNKYDVVLYKRGETYILHRILRVLSDGYIIAGDNNTFLEYDIKDEHIIGVMVRVIRDGKEIRMTDIKYRLYVHIWCDFYPIRMILLKIKRKLWRVGSYLKRKLLFQAEHQN